MVSTDEVIVYKSLLIAAVLLSSGCQKLPNLGNINLSDYLPNLKFDKFKAESVDFQGIDSSFVFDIENPYPVNLTLARFNYDLDLEGTGFLSGNADKGIDLKASTTSKTAIPARIEFADVFNLVADLKGKDDVGFGIRGKFGFDTPAGAIDAPFDETGRVPTLKVPEIKPKAVRVSGVNLLQQTATLAVDLSITNKANAASYGLQQFGYGIDLGGARIVDGTLDDLSVAAGATETVTLPIEVNLLELGSTIVAAITQKKPLDVRLDAGLSVNTPLGAIPLNVDETVNLRLQ